MSRLTITTDAETLAKFVRNMQRKIRMVNNGEIYYPHVNQIRVAYEGVDVMMVDTMQQLDARADDARLNNIIESEQQHAEDEAQATLDPMNTLFNLGMSLLLPEETMAESIMSEIMR